MSLEKIKTEKELEVLAQELKANGKKIGFSSGAFDLLHAGHIQFLQAAKKKCDCLIIALNSDQSVQEIKGQGRPFNQETDRAEVLSALEAVDFIVLKDDRRNERLIELLKPDFYFKGGDYKLEELTSKTVLEKFGGQAVILPLSEGKSTTELAKKITGSKKAEKNEQRLRHKAVFLDRDGVINKEVEFLHEPEKFEFLPNAIEGIEKMKAHGFKIAVATNQPGIGLGYFTKEDLFKVNRTMLKGFSAKDIYIDKVYFCPHSVAQECGCRKPKTGMIERGAQELDLDLSQSFFIGDKTSDIKAGKTAGLKTILVKTGRAGSDKRFEVKPDFEAQDLLEAAQFIIKQDFRQSMTEKRSLLPEKEVQKLSQAVKKNVFSLPEFQKSKNICFYLSKEKEVSTISMVNDCLNQGKNVSVPITDSEGNIRLSRIYSLDDLVEGSFRIPEPKNKEFISQNEVELFIVPGTAFDLKGNRIGFGKGCYDRLFSQPECSQAKKVGLAFDFQVVEKLPSNEKDRAMDLIVTEKQIYRK